MLHASWDFQACVCLEFKQIDMITEMLNLLQHFLFAVTAQN